MFRWRCGICEQERDCRALALNNEYLSFVCDKGHHQVGYGQKRFCKNCNKETLQLELLHWRRGEKSEYRIVGLLCCECGNKEEFPEPTAWRSD